MNIRFDKDLQIIETIDARLVWCHALCHLNSLLAVEGHITVFSSPQNLSKAGDLLQTKMARQRHVIMCFVHLDNNGRGTK